MADIELVIKIPEEKYKWIKENNPKADKDSVVGAIVHGKPLPEGAIILTKEAYSDLCMRAAEGSDKE